jgi:ribonuclease HII
MKFIAGIDEVGRGPLAGPVAVGVVLFKKENEKKLKVIFKDARDSKKLTPKKREEISGRLLNLEKTKILRHVISYQSAQMVDELGINKAIQRCLDSCLARLKVNPKNSQIFLDGGLKASKKFINQKTVIKGDDKILAISLASIVAKVSRDALMTKMSKKFPQYDFHINKGYGTSAHRLALKNFDLSSFHRKSFCKNF